MSTYLYPSPTTYPGTAAVPGVYSTMLTVVPPGTEVRYDVPSPILANISAGGSLFPSDALFASTTLFPDGSASVIINGAFDYPTPILANIAEESSLFPTLTLFPSDGLFFSGATSFAYGVFDMPNPL